MFNLDPDSTGNGPLNTQFELMGYFSLYIVQNFGMMCITLYMPVIARVLTIIIVFLLSGWTKIFNIDLTQIKVKSAQWLQYGFWISFLDETYLFLLVCVSLNLREYFYW
jgi:hypothetical protein